MARKRPPFDIGEPVDLDVRFYDQNDDLNDPADITLRLVCPDNTTLTFTKAQMEQLETGKWRYTYEIANGYGTYKGTWTAEGVIDVIRQFSFPVRKPDSG